jgi:hypothetical protein
MTVFSVTQIWQLQIYGPKTTTSRCNQWDVQYRYHISLYLIPEKVTPYSKHKTATHAMGSNLLLADVFRVAHV